jgi:glycosyltransferase involved in cell wall biosynthesis
MDGVGMVAHNYASWLNTKYGKSCLVAPMVKGYTDKVDYKVIRFKSVLLPGMNPYRIGLPFIDFEFKENLAKFQFDILHTHCPFISGHLALRLARKQKIPVVTTLHSKYRDDFEKAIGNKTIIKFMMKMLIDFYNQADHVWIPNRSTGNTLREYGFNGNYEVMHNGTDIQIPEKSNYLNLRKKGLEAIGAKDNDFILLFVGQHRWEKNIKTIIDSLRIVKSRGETFKMFFAGEGNAVEDMKKLVKKYELTDEVRFLGVISDRNKLMEIYACSNLFVFPSVYDTSPLVIREAAAFDVPSIIIRNSSTAEDINENVNGFLIDNTQEALAQKIIELKQNPQAILKAGINARKSLYRSWESVVDEVFVQYELIIRDHAKKSGKL